MHLRAPWVLFEKEERLGGHARTDDATGTISTRPGTGCTCAIRTSRQLVDELLPGQMVPSQRKARIFSHGVLTRSPSRPTCTACRPRWSSECLLGFIEAHETPRPTAPPEELRGVLPAEVRRRDLASTS